MIKKLWNQPHAPKVGASSQVGAKGSKKKNLVIYINSYELSQITQVLFRRFTEMSWVSSGHQTVDKIQKASNPKCNIQLLDLIKT
jgi:hypothetical protein